MLSVEIRLFSRFFASAGTGSVSIFVLVIATFAGVWFWGVCVHTIYVLLGRISSSCLCRSFSAAITNSTTIHVYRLSWACRSAIIFVRRAICCKSFARCSLSGTVRMVVAAERVGVSQQYFEPFQGVRPSVW
jgi:hypothetical protein